MGRIRETLTGTRSPGDAVDAVFASAAFDPSTYPLATPFGSSDLQRIVATDVFGTDLPPTSRAAAMRVPAIARARNLLVSTISRFPMRVYRGAVALPDDQQPTWTYATDQALSPQLRLAWTVDDLLFYGWSCWSRENNADGFPGRLSRVERERWKIDGDNRVVIDDQPQRDRDVLLIPGLHEGILSFGVDAIRDARTLQTIVRDRLLNPVPAVELHQTAGEPMTDEQIDALIARWAAARQGKHSGVSYTNELIELKTHGGDDGNLLIEARNAAAVDMARLIGVSAGRIDATTPKASLNYETTTGRNQEFVDFDLALYMTPITARLSLDDCLPRGQRVAFDLTDFTAVTPSVSGPAVND